MTTKLEMLVDETIKLSAKYKIKMTLRQIYYRLVAKGVLKNTISEYKYLSKSLVAGRKKGLIPYSLMEDRTRTIKNFSKQWYISPSDYFDLLVKEISESTFMMPNNLYQEKIVVVALEKDALASIFENVVKDQTNTFLIVCRGFNSLTQLNELSTLLLEDGREVHCIFFSDYDPSGFCIQDNFETQMSELGITFESFTRIALTKPQITQYSLPSAPVKSKDSRSKGWIGGVVELDALDPPILEQMIREAISPFWDDQLEQEVLHLKSILSRKYDNLLQGIKDTLNNEGYNI